MAKAKTAAKAISGKKSNTGPVLIGLAATAALIGMPFWQASTTADWAMRQLLGAAAYRSSTAMPGLDGFSVNNVEIATAGAPVKIGTVKIATPLMWNLAATYTRSMFKPALNSAQIRFDDIQNPDGLSFADTTLPIGPVSLALAELEGCGDLKRLSPAQLGELGLKIGATSLTLDVSVAGSEVTSARSWITPGLGSATFTRTGSGERPAERLLDDTGLPRDIVWKSMRWTLNDQGFNKARNAFCARESGVAVETFLANHLASVERVLAAIGVAATPEMRLQYLDYAANGGKLSISGDTAELAERDLGPSTDWKTMLTSMRGEMQRGQQRVAINFTAQRERPFGESDAELTTYQVLKKEGVTVDSLAIPDLGSLVAAASPANTGKSAAEISAANKATNETASDTMVVSVKVEPYLTSQLVQIEMDEPEYVTSFDALGNLAGRRVRIERRARPVMVAKVLGRNGTAVRLRVNQGSGFAEIDIAKGDFVRAQVYPLR